MMLTKNFSKILIAVVVATTLTTLTTANASAQNLIPESAFDGGSTGAWWVTDNLDVGIEDGQLCATVTDDGGTNPWDTLIGHGDLRLEAGRTYDFNFDLRAANGISVVALVQMSAEPWTEYYGLDAVGNGATAHYNSPYQQGNDDATGQLIFQFGGQGAGTVCIDNIVLGPPAAPPIEQNAVHANQLGYFVDGAKHATVVTAETVPLVWTLLGGNGSTALQGMTTVFGVDEGTGLNVHVIDFSDYGVTGVEYTMQVGSFSSHPFVIDENPYGELLYDAFRYYYYARSTDPLVMPYVDDAQWLRPAGPADDSVVCWPDSGCDYRLDLSKGWYDAGDYGKYVVNSGFSVWQLMNLYERGLHIDNNMLALFADNTMNIPESRNGTPDLLDEVRYNLEFMLGMQVPDGEVLAGMAHHKMHNTEWHEAGTPPFEIDGADRVLTPPTTIAALYFAGATAQCARIWADVDAAFSARCLTASEKAWAAAIANPAVTHPDEPYNNGGGPYGNLDAGDAIEDEFYWAAAELFITTGKSEYSDFLLASPNHLAPPEVPIASFEVDMMGRMSLSVVPNDLLSDELDAVKASIVGLADVYVNTVNTTGFGVPISADFFYWGSNSTLLNELMIVATAYDLTEDAVYLSAVQEGMNYIFGRNPLGQSYVTGHGERAARNPTSSWYANSVNPERPIAPPGFLVGGANITHPDIFATEALEGCAGTTCYIDHIRAYSTNETGINVNASLVWVTSFLMPPSVHIPVVERNILFLPLIGR